MCALFGAAQTTMEFTIKEMLFYAWGFIIMSLNVMISAYFYSTKRSTEAVIISVLRSLIVNSAMIVLLPAISGSGIIYY